MSSSMRWATRPSSLTAPRRPVTIGPKDGADMGRRTADLAAALGLTAAGGGAIAAVMARARRREGAARQTAAREHRRAELLSRAGELLDGRRDLRPALAELAALAVPDLAELCLVALL